MTFWNQKQGNSMDQPDEEFRDMPDEVSGEEAQGAPPMFDNTGRLHPQNHHQQMVGADSQESVEEIIDEVVESEEDEAAEMDAALSDARMRLEMGRLFEMVMTNDLFQNMDADPQAVKSVTRSLKRFAKEQMEIMLGMRAERPKETVVSSPFNDLEVTVLKKLASAASKGLTERENAKPIPEKHEGPQPPPKNKTLTPISKNAGRTKPAPLPKAAPAPVKRAMAPAPVPSAIVKPENYKPLEKPIHEMTPEELAARNAEAADRLNGKKAALPTNRAPMPDPAQQEALFTHQALQSSSAVSMIMSAIQNQKK